MLKFVNHYNRYFLNMETERPEFPLRNDVVRPITFLIVAFLLLASVPSAAQDCPSTPPTVYGPATVCKGGHATYSLNPASVPPIGRVEFFAPGMTVVSRSSFSITVSVPGNFTSGQVVAYTVVGPCGAGPARVINVSSASGAVPGEAGPITGSVSVAPGQSSVQYSVPPVQGVDSYDWVLPHGSHISSGAGTNSVRVSFHANFAGGTLHVSGKKGTCLGPPSSLDISSTSCSDLTLGSVSGPASVCPGQSGVKYTVPANPSATQYVWTLPSGTQQVTTSNELTVNFSSSASSGSLKVHAVGTSCYAGPSTSRSISVPNTKLTISRYGSSCGGQGGGISFQADQLNGSDYKWYKNGALVTDNDPNVPGYVYRPLGNLKAGDRIKCTARFTNSCVSNLLATSNELGVVIQQPVSPWIRLDASVSLPANLCQGDNISFRARPGGPGYTLSNFQWRLNGNVVPNNSTDTYSTTNFSQGDVISVSVTVAGSCITSSHVSTTTQGYPITVVERPSATLSPGGLRRYVPRALRRLRPIRARASPIPG